MKRIVRGTGVGVRGALSAALTTAALATAVLASGLVAAGCAEESPSGKMRWEDFERSARREFDGQVSYVIEGDLPVTHDQLREYYRDVVAGNGFSTQRSESIVNRVNGADDVWNGDQKRDLSYCVSNDFGTNKARAVTEMRNASGAWEEAANVRFRYVPGQDGGCTGANTNVTFAVRPWTSGGACAFFPSGGGCVARTVVMNFADFDNNYGDDAPNLTTTGVFRHELGHVLGLRHEHTRPESGGCFENNNWRALTPYDSQSVMHYPWCPGGVFTSDQSLTTRDIEGIRSLYGARSRTGTSGKIASVSRIERHMESLWVAPNGSVQGAWWYVEAGAWTRYQLAAASSASPTGGVALTSRVPTHLEALWIAPNGSVQGAWWYESGGGWQFYQLAPAGSASVNGGISLVSRTSTSLDAVWIGADGSVQGAFWEEGAFPWTRYTLAAAGSAALDANPLLLSRLPRHMEAFWIAPGGVMGGAWWYEGAAGQRVWSARYSLASGAVTGAGIGGVSRTQDRMEVFWIGSGGTVQAAKWVLGSPWQTYQLATGASASGGVAALSRQPDHMEAFWTGSGGSVIGSWWYDSGNAWSPSYALGSGGSSSANATFGVTSRFRSHMEVLWPGASGSLEEGFWLQGSPWARRQVAGNGNVSTSQ